MCFKFFRAVKKKLERLQRERKKMPQTAPSTDGGRSHSELERGTLEGQRRQIMSLAREHRKWIVKMKF